MKRIYSVTVENRFGVLSKVAGLFSRRSFNIDSLTVGETEDPTISNMTIVSTGDERTIEQIEKQLNKKLDVIKVRTFKESESVSRELMLIKVKYTKTSMRELVDICNFFAHADIVDRSNKQAIIQICDTPDQVQLLIHKLQSVGIVEVARTGTLALQKCRDAE